MLKVCIIGPDGAPVGGEELRSLYASDLEYIPYRRRSAVGTDGSVELTVPEGPVILHAKLNVPGFCRGMWVVADNCGKGYPADAEIDFIREAAQSRICAVREVIGSGEFTPSPKCLSLLRDAESLCTMAEGCPAQATAYRMAALAAGLWSGELAVVERAQERIRRHGKREFLFGAGGFAYPYDGAVQWRGRSRRIDPKPGMPGMKECFDSVFNYATLPFYLADREREYGKPDYSYLDHLEREFSRSGITVKGHPLWWAHTAGRPDWTKELRFEDGSLRREIRRTILHTLDHFRGRVRIYDAINENHDWCNAWNLTQEQQTEMTRFCCEAIREADPTVTAVVNNCFMFGENAADGRTQWGPTWERNLVPYTAIRNLEEAGVSYDVIGMQLYNPARDMLQIDRLIDRFEPFGHKIHFTELGVPSFEKALSPNTTPGDVYCLSYMYYGIWHELGWNERLQADWVEQFYTVAYSHASVEALTMWNLEDPGYVPASGLFTEAGEPKESYFRLKELERSWGFDLGNKKT